MINVRLHEQSNKCKKEKKMQMFTYQIGLRIWKMGEAARGVGAGREPAESPQRPRQQVRAVKEQTVSSQCPLLETQPETTG